MKTELCFACDKTCTEHVDEDGHLLLGHPFSRRDSFD